MKLNMFSALVISSAALLSAQYASAQEISNNQGPQTAEQRAAAEANAAKLKEGVASAFSFGKGLFNKTVEAGQAGISKLSTQNSTGNKDASNPSAEAPSSAPPTSSGITMSSLAQKTSEFSHTSQGQMAQKVLGTLVPGGDKVLHVASKALDAKVGKNAPILDSKKPPALEAKTVTASSAEASVADMSAPALIKTGLNLGGGLLDKLKKNRLNSEGPNNNAPTP
jgi:hypothetical protein